VCLWPDAFHSEPENSVSVCYAIFALSSGAEQRCSCRRYLCESHVRMKPWFTPGREGVQLCIAKTHLQIGASSHNFFLFAPRQGKFTLRQLPLLSLSARARVAAVSVCGVAVLRAASVCEPVAVGTGSWVMSDPQKPLTEKQNKRGYLHTKVPHCT